MSTRFSLPAVVIVVLVLVATGCLRTTTTVVVGDDGAGTAQIVMAVNARAVIDQGTNGLLQLPADLVPSDPAAVCDRMNRAIALLNVPVGATTSDYRDDTGFCGQTITIAFADPQALSTAFETLSGTVFDHDMLSRHDDQWLFDAPVIEPLDLLPTQTGTIPPGALDQLAKQRQLTYVVTLPGEREGDSNADLIDGGTFTWVISPDDTRTNLVALTNVSATGGDGVPVLPVALGAAAAAVAAGAGLVAWTRRTRSGPLSPNTAVVGDLPPSDRPWAMPGDEQGTSLAGASGGASTRLANPEDPIVAEPRWDPDRDAWVADHPVEGLLVHDDATGQWRRA
jgi:hypothetical protein